MRRVILCMLVLVLSTQVIAQDDVCPVIVEQALEALADNCTEMPRNSACYGYQTVNATFVTELPPETFSQPADREILNQFDSLHTSPYNADLEEWGIALMNVQANVPDTVPGQAVRFLLLGDAQVENRVAPTDFSIESNNANPIIIRLQFEAVARTRPMDNANTVATLPAGTTINANAVNATGDWLRGDLDGREVWIARDFVVPNIDIESLPVTSDAPRTPMQSFYFSTGFGESRCNRALDVVTIQSPENITVDLTVNGLDVRIGSTISFQNLSDDRIVIMVHEGTLQTADMQTVTTGEALIGVLGPDGDIIGWEETRPLNERELEIGEIVTAALASLTPETIAESPAPDSSSATTTTTITHTVQAGETLYSIAQRYDASIPEIVEANGIADVNRIAVGAQLTIPNAGSGFVNLSTTTTTGTTSTQPQQPTTSTFPFGNPFDMPFMPPFMDNLMPGNIPLPNTPGGGAICAGFRPTSPLSGLAFGVNQFYWDAPAGAVDSYRVNVVNLENGRTLSGTVAAPTTTLAFDLSVQNIGNGFDFYWNVQALLNGVPVCATNNVVLQRAAAPIIGGFTASWECDGANLVKVLWSNAQAGDSITITFNTLAGPAGGTFPADPPQATFGPHSTVSNGVVTTSSGDTVTLQPATINAGACP